MTDEIQDWIAKQTQGIGAATTSAFTQGISTSATHSPLTVQGLPAPSDDAYQDRPNKRQTKGTENDETARKLEEMMRLRSGVGQ